MLFLSLKADPQNGNPMRTPMASIMTSFTISLGSFGNIWEQIAESTDHPYIGQVRYRRFLCRVDTVRLSG